MIIKIKRQLKAGGGIFYQTDFENTPENTVEKSMCLGGLFNCIMVYFQVYLGESHQHENTPQSKKYIDGTGRFKFQAVDK